MDRQKVRHGMKVVPHSKTADGRSKGLEKSAEWNKALKMNQPYLYVTRIRFNRNDDSYPEVLLGTEYGSDTGDYFLISDFTKYESQQLNKILNR